MTHSFESKYDVVVVGSGHNGLVAAAYMAKAGKSVLVLEKNQTLGGATASQQVFPDYDALLSRYSYLVSLLPDKIIKDLNLQFETRRRATASFTPWKDTLGRQRGLVLSNVDDSRSRDSLFEMTGHHSAWNRYQEFLDLQASIAKVIWPTMLQPLRSRNCFASRLKTEQQRNAWKAFVDQPLGQTIEHFADHDALRGLLMTDGKIGVFTHAHDPSLLQNRCFLYHIIGNETGEWKVPVGGMKSLVDALLQRCRTLGVHFATEAPASNVDVGPRQHSVTFSTDNTEHCVDATHVFVNAGSATFARLFQQSWTPHSEDEGSVIKMNFLLKRLPKLKATGTTSNEAFCGSFHIDEGYQQMQQSWETAQRGEIPNPTPGEVYCHTLTDNSILSKDLQQSGFHTLTLFGLDMPYRLFETDHDSRKATVAERYTRGLNQLCDESFEDCIAEDASGQPCIEIKTPQDLRTEIGLDQGNIFHNAPSWFYGDDQHVGTWGVETEFSRVYKAGSSALRGGAVSGIPGHNAAMCALSKER
ncbi:MAG: NAD(P)/FAD-dependent oxidoreductase [Fuerstiella sp.]